MGYKNRDVEVVCLDQGLCLVTACDSCGGIGSKKMDLLKVPGQLVGQMTARLVLMEVICTGARPRVMTAAISCEAHPTGNEILEGIRAELESAGFPNLALAVSTEKNFSPSQTGLGIGLTGTCTENDLKIALAEPGDSVFCLGSPLVGQEVAQAPPSQIISTGQILALLGMPHIHEILPVGSRGIAAEAQGLAAQARARFIPAQGLQIDMEKSAGPSTCALFTCKTDKAPEIAQDLWPELVRIGKLTPL